MQQLLAGGRGDSVALRPRPVLQPRPRPLLALLCAPVSPTSSIRQQLCVSVYKEHKVCISTILNVYVYNIPVHVNVIYIMETLCSFLPQSCYTVTFTLTRHHLLPANFPHSSNILTILSGYWLKTYIKLTSCQ